MIDRVVSRVPAPLAKRGLLARRGLLASLAIAGLAGAFAWRAPEANGWAAAALTAALVLDGLARAAGTLVARRAGPGPRISGMPSVVLAPGAGLGAVLFGAGLIVWPAGFPVLASALAGLVAMGALARLALARIVLKAPEEPEV